MDPRNPGFFFFFFDYYYYYYDKNQCKCITERAWCEYQEKLVRMHEANFAMVASIRPWRGNSTIEFV